MSVRQSAGTPTKTGIRPFFWQARAGASPALIAAELDYVAASDTR